MHNLSKSLSYWLRHNPDDIGINLSDGGWTDVNTLITMINKRFPITFENLKYIVDNNNKKRFSFNNDYSEIRANQGHSIEVDLKLDVVIPPKILYHGTPIRNVDIILIEGLNKMDRHHVHLSDNKDTAAKVGARRGEFKILQIEALKMSEDGYKFYISDNGVYLTDYVPVNYIC